MGRSSLIHALPAVATPASHSLVPSAYLLLLTSSLCLLHTLSFPIKCSLFLSLSVHALGSEKLLKCMVYAILSLYTSSHSTPTTDGPHGFFILGAGAPCQFSFLLTSWQNFFPHDPFLLTD